MPLSDTILAGNVRGALVNLQRALAACHDAGLTVELYDVTQDGLSYVEDAHNLEGTTFKVIRTVRTEL